MIAYHVSKENYPVGTIVRLGGTSRFVSRLTSKDPHYLKLEEEIDKARPLPAQPRSTALYAFPVLEACRAFWEGEQGFGEFSTLYQGTPNYYEVEILSPTYVVNRLSSHASRRMKKCLPHDDVVREYWSPTLGWQCLEILCSEFKVIGQVAAPSLAEVISYKGKYEADRLLAQRTWPL